MGWAKTQDGEHGTHGILDGILMYTRVGRRPALPP
jgi:hypothetical protein